jgi:cobalamin synthase
LVATLLAHFALARLGGLTGDVYGMLCEGVETSLVILGAALAK